MEEHDYVDGDNVKEEEEEEKDTRAYGFDDDWW